MSNVVYIKSLLTLSYYNLNIGQGYTIYAYDEILTYLTYVQSYINLNTCSALRLLRCLYFSCMYVSVNPQITHYIMKCYHDQNECLFLGLHNNSLITYTGFVLILGMAEQRNWYCRECAVQRPVREVVRSNPVSVIFANFGK